MVQQEEEGPLRLTYDLTHDYLEVARSYTMPLYLPQEQKVFIEKHGPDPFNNAVFSLISISVVYSYLALESFINKQLYDLWASRQEDSPTAKRFQELLGNPDTFGELKTNKTTSNKVRDLDDRIKTLYKILGFELLHTRNPSLWEDFLKLVQASRHFLVHPDPDVGSFQKSLKRIFEETKSGTYVNVVTSILRDMYEQSEREPPSWLSTNTLLRFRGADLLVGRDLDSGSVAPQERTLKSLSQLAQVVMAGCAMAGLLSLFLLWQQVKLQTAALAQNVLPIGSIGPIVQTDGTRAFSTFERLHEDRPDRFGIRFNLLIQNIGKGTLIPEMVATIVDTTTVPNLIQKVLGQGNKVEFVPRSNWMRPIRPDQGVIVPFEWRDLAFAPKYYVQLAFFYVDISDKYYATDCVLRLDFGAPAIVGQNIESKVEDLGSNEAYYPLSKEQTKRIKQMLVSEQSIAP